VNSGVWNEAVGQRKNTACAFTNWIQTYRDPSDVFGLCLDGERITEVHCNNTSFYSNPRVNTLLREAAREAAQLHRLELYRRAEALVVQDAPWVFLYHPIDYRLCQPWVKGYEMHPVWPVRYERLWKEPR
jgi:ABC-type oligopeptide transport system substrate-binding subunit